MKKLHPSLRQRHRAGEKCEVFVDYSGKRLHLIDPETGELIPVELFVGVLGASGYLFAEATAGQTLPEWIDIPISGCWNLMAAVPPSLYRITCSVASRTRVAMSPKSIGAMPIGTLLRRGGDPRTGPKTQGQSQGGSRG